MTPVLQLQSVSKLFPHQTAVDNVSLSLSKGEFFSLIGPSGCGKTTTLRLVAGFEELTSGSIYLNGVDIAAQPPHRRDVSTVFQNYALFPHLSVAANIAFGLERRNSLTRAEIKTRVGEMLDLLQLTGKESRLPKQLSGGERQRVALARSLVVRPSVLLLDEPLSALDPKLRRHVRAELKAIQSQVEIAFLFVTHDQEEALAISDRIGVMHNGRLLQTGSGEAIYRKPTSRFVAEFLGEISWLSPDRGVRPEAFQLHASPRSGACEATVRHVEFLGSRLRVHSMLASGQPCLTESTASSFLPVAGQRVWLTWDAVEEIYCPYA